jgi:hypothetical protein
MAEKGRLERSELEALPAIATTALFGDLVIVRNLIDREIMEGDAESTR